MDRHTAARTLQPSWTSSAQALYYFNVDAILSELIRPATPKHGNLARPRLVKPEPIRPQQLIGTGGGFFSSSHGHGRSSIKTTPAPLTPLNDRTEGARNPDPIQQQLSTPFAINDEEEEDDVGMNYSSGDVMNSYYNTTSGSSKRSRDDEDIVYYKKSTKSTTATNMEEKVDAALVTPNPIQYYSASVDSSHPTMPSTMVTDDNEPQYIVFKNFIDDSKNSSNVNYENDVHRSSSSNNHLAAYHHFPNGHHAWTTTTPSTTVSYTIVKPVAMRPMDVIQHLHHFRMDHNDMMTQPDAGTTGSSCPSVKNSLHADVLDDGSMQVCG